MLIDMKKMMASNNISVIKQFEIAVLDLGFGAIDEIQAPVRVHACFVQEQAAVQLELKLSFHIEACCDRCLDKISESKVATFRHEIVIEQANSEELFYADGIEVLIAEDGIFDLNACVYSNLILGIPTKYLCREDCKGLCSRCGKNLNHETCFCERNTVDPRLEVLKQLLEQG